MTTDQIDKTARIAALNDEFRTSFGRGGTIAVTVGTRLDPALPRIFAAVQNFRNFSPDSPEHDFGAVNVSNQSYFFKIDYYASDSLDTGSDDPADPEKTHRVMTIMRADEY